LNGHITRKSPPKTLSFSQALYSNLTNLREDFTVWTAKISTKRLQIFGANLALTDSIIKKSKTKKELNSKVLKLDIDLGNLNSNSYISKELEQHTRQIHVF